MQPALPAEALVLVAILPYPRYLEIVRVFGQYRIPGCCVSKTVDLAYLFFNQTVRFSSETWFIQYFFQVLGHDLTTCAERLNLVEEIDDRVVGSIDRELLWRGLRESELPAKQDCHPASISVEFELVPFCRTGDLGISLGDVPANPSTSGWTALYLPDGH